MNDLLKHDAGRNRHRGWRSISVIRKAGWFLPLIAGACATIPPEVTAPKPIPHFSAQAFFAGRTEGRGTLKIIFAKARQVAVHGRGRLSGDGTLILDQSVEEGEGPPKQREWRIKPMTIGLYAGTLSDARGPVRGDVHGNRLHLHFTMKGGLDADQWLSLSPDGRSADNVMLVRKFGVTVATLHETIRKVD